MSTFRFPLQRLLDLRAKRQDEIARQLAHARVAADHTRAARDALAAAREAGAEQVNDARAASPTIGEMTSRAFALSQLDQRLAVASDALRAAEAHVTEMHGALTDAVQDRRVLDRLRERLLEAHRAAESQQDRTTMDAIALQRFARTTSDAATNGEGK